MIDKILRKFRRYLSRRGQVTAQLPEPRYRSCTLRENARLRPLLLHPSPRPGFCTLSSPFTSVLDGPLRTCHSTCKGPNSLRLMTPLIDRPPGKGRRMASMAPNTEKLQLLSPSVIDRSAYRGDVPGYTISTATVGALLGMYVLSTQTEHRPLEGTPCENDANS